MRKLGFGFVAAVLAILTLWGGRSIWGSITTNREAIAKVTVDAVRLVSERDSLVTVVRNRDTLIVSLDLRRDSLESVAQSWRDSIDALERIRAASQLAVRESPTVAAIQAELRASYPELGDSAWRVSRIPLGKADTVGIDVLMVPAWFAETFVIEHGDAQSWRAQRDELLAGDSLRSLIIAQQDSITLLQATNTNAYRAGYQAAYTGYLSISKRYVAELKKPRITFGSTFRFVAAAGAGVLFGRAIR